MSIDTRHNRPPVPVVIRVDRTRWRWHEHAAAQACNVPAEDYGRNVTQARPRGPQVNPSLHVSA